MTHVKKQVLLILLLVACISQVNGFAYDPKYQKKIDKELERIFDLVPDNPQQLAVLTDSVSGTVSEFYQLKHKTQELGYLCITQGLGRFETFDFLILYDTKRLIKDIKILEYRSSYGYEIGSRSWLQQFYDSDTSATFKINENVQAMTGASVSSRGIVDAINRANQDLKKLH